MSKFRKIGIIFLMSAVFTTGCSSTNSLKSSNSSNKSTSTKKADTSRVTDILSDKSTGKLTDADKKLSIEGYGAKGALSDKNLSIADMLNYAIEDEFLAHREYSTIIEKLNTDRPYSNIKQSEEMHIEYLKQIYDNYGLEFPEDKSKDHIKIPKTLLEAGETGVKAEIDNIAMYDLFLKNKLPEDIKEVFTILRDGSKSHLLAFEKQVERLK